MSKIECGWGRPTAGGMSKIECGWGRPTAGGNVQNRVRLGPPSRRNIVSKIECCRGGPKLRTLGNPKPHI
jgi:hypothetical protein